MTLETILTEWATILGVIICVMAFLGLIGNAETVTNENSLLSHFAILGDIALLMVGGIMAVGAVILIVFLLFS